MTHYYSSSTDECRMSNQQKRNGWRTEFREEKGRVLSFIRRPWVPGIPNPARVDGLTLLKSFDIQPMDADMMLAELMSIYQQPYAVLINMGGEQRYFVLNNNFRGLLRLVKMGTPDTFAPPTPVDWRTDLNDEVGEDDAFDSVTSFHSDPGDYRNSIQHMLRTNADLFEQNVKGIIRPKTAEELANDANDPLSFGTHVWLPADHTGLKYVR